ncbi:ejaculatory bulb-specific protein 3 [Anabrus simplex]|uniref:ejaculatory bulb-specific protein 3 n=1 Tax=Anabrus simplex TaxID=316456 RepID=UPI0035A2793A
MDRLYMFLTISLALLSSVVAQQKYNPKWDTVDVDQILRNDRLFNKYVSCLLSDTDTDCTEDGKELKKAIPDALKTECSKCTEKQVKSSEKVIRHLIDNKPDVWAKLEAKYDSTGSYRKKYQEEAKKRGIIVKA